MNEQQALAAFEKMCEQAAAAGTPVDCVEVSKNGRNTAIYGLHQKSAVAWGLFTSDNSTRVLEQRFWLAARNATTLHTTSRTGIRHQKSALPLHHAAINLTVKAVDDGKRTLSGIATSPAPDRMGDIIEPLGCRFQNPIPLLWAHDAKQPVGKAWLLSPTPEGIAFKGEIADIKEAGTLKSRCDEAWQSVKAGLVSSVSIGFRALTGGEVLRSGGRRFDSTEIMELSLVTIPAQPDARITAVKADEAAEQKSVTTEQVKAQRSVAMTVDQKPVKLIRSSQQW